ncbi:MAG: glycogen synthase [Candidatus Limnocylindrales bacterium]
MRIAMVSAECEPFAKTGGLADAVDGLARALGERGHTIDVFLPRYGHAPLPGAATARRSVDLAGTRVAVVDVAADGYRARLVEHAPSFDRSGYYGDAAGDYPDNGARFALLGRAALVCLAEDAADGRPAEVLHGHDWQAGPALLQLLEERPVRPDQAPVATLLTCHNLAYQGHVPAGRVAELGLHGLPAGQAVDLLGLALERVELANTVSPTYARESLRRAYGAGLEEVLRARGDRYLGILNGLDGRLWDPATDADLAATYGPVDPAGKAVAKAALLRRHGLSDGRGEDGWDDRGAPLLGLVGRLDPQKGFDLLTAAAPRLLDLGARIVVLGTGEAGLIAGLRDLAAQRPERVSVLDRFDRTEARRIYAGADAFLMPSRFEPCGLSQMIALRYGTPPIVRATGGLADTVIDADAQPGTGTGFAFGPAEPGALLDAVERATRAYRQAERWTRIVGRGMAVDLGWDKPAAAYEAAYRRAVRIRAGQPAAARPTKRRSIP